MEGTLHTYTNMKRGRELLLSGIPLQRLETAGAGPVCSWQQEPNYLKHPSPAAFQGMHQQKAKGFKFSIQRYRPNLTVTFSSQYALSAPFLCQYYTNFVGVGEPT